MPARADRRWLAGGADDLSVVGWLEGLEGLDKQEARVLLITRQIVITHALYFDQSRKAKPGS